MIIESDVQNNWETSTLHIRGKDPIKTRVTKLTNNMRRLQNMIFLEKVSQKNMWTLMKNIMITICWPGK